MRARLGASRLFSWWVACFRYSGEKKAPEQSGLKVQSSWLTVRRYAQKQTPPRLIGANGRRPFRFLARSRRQLLAKVLHRRHRAARLKKSSIVSNLIQTGTRDRPMLIGRFPSSAPDPRAALG